ncbi:valine--tRNA ligase [Halocynthiibacter styelae]|uniref:Valine--tRNA ligase n=1 Tax=Halocynthiibacter styelae TaxID=2761955 RepID=A0A8J7ICY5_9RHOB|nr:valine--tRNA ligase [Paenihalocynthiibacter styelae]MBI1493364.1 valine--tRNA ligase [Paenihalocynthiibacter styelae]
MAMEKNFDAGKREAEIYAKWEADGAFKAGANKRDGADPYTIMIPPPNVTGALHMGHAFNNTLQDILIRWKRMQGFDVLWQPGTDHAGIATQMVTEREMAENGEPSRREMGREKFLDRVWQQKVKSRGNIIGQLKRLGASADWSREAFTMGGAKGDPDLGKGAPNFHDAVIKVFVEMYNKGLIYRGKRLVNWDPHFETAISDLEVENIETPGHMWHFKYPLADGVTYTYIEKDEDGNITLQEERDYISIATTRPETMLGDGAVAVHPSDERYAPLIGKLCEIPVGPKEHRRLIPIITDEYPDKDFGSGAVKITGAHDFNDFQVAKRGGIPMYRLMDTKGAMRADGAPYGEESAKAQAFAKGAEFTENSVDAINLVPEELRGMDRFDARKAVVDQITSEGLAVMHEVTREEKNEDGEKVQITETVAYVENKPIMQPFGDRSKVVIEPMFTDQWFVDAKEIVGPALDSVRNGDVKIIPESGEKVFYHWLDNIEPWCISRQLWWGHQIPVWFGPKVDDHGKLSPQDRKEFCASNENEAIALAQEYYRGHFGEQVKIFAAADPDDAISRLQAKAGRNPAASGSSWGFGDDGTILDVDIVRDPDVLDTWFSSGLWPIGTLGWPEDTPEYNTYFPTSTLITGQDILFFWVARMMMMQQAVVGQNPFDTVYLHGLVRDSKGKKMSKSVGNVIDPLELIDEYGADALRFASAAMASLGGTLKLDTARIQGYRNFGTKLWNSVSFALTHVEAYADYTPSATPPKATAALNKWIIGEVAKVQAEVNEAFDSFRFNDAAQALYAFTRGKLCDWYIEFSKPLLGGDDAALIAETKATLAWTIDQALIMLHPIMPFITEELWGLTAERAKPVIHADWPELSADLVDADADREMNWVIALIDGIRSARAQMRVPAGLKIPVILQSLDDKGRTALANNEVMIKKLARIDSITEMADLPKGASPVPVEGGTFALPLADVIDVDAEIARLEKGMQKLAKELGGLRGRLKNPKFADSAPAEVVAETRENLALREEEEATINAALTRLREIG